MRESTATLRCCFSATVNVADLMLSINISVYIYIYRDAAVTAWNALAVNLSMTAADLMLDHNNNSF